MTLSRREQETIIVFDEEDKIASVEVPIDSRLDRRLMKLDQEPVEQFKLKKKVVSNRYEVPASWIKINAPKKMTDEQRAELAERARKNFGK
ncbi:MAG TPA: hypothetical protein PK684_10450 [Bacillota bacterium]|nr:hypothetical protein [Bacillota bacterium]